MPAQFSPPAPPEEASVILTAWHLMGAQIDWSALDTITEMLGVTDVEQFIHLLSALRDHLRSEAD